MAITATDVSVATNGDIRWTGNATTYYTVLELHRFLQNLADDAAGSGDDLVDITSSTPSERSTDNIITLLGTYNIDDTMAQHLFDGSITQASGATMYSGLVVVGSVNNVNTELQIVQNGKLLPTYWGTGINTVAAANILLRTLVKTRTGGGDIDGKRIRIQAREIGDTYAEFSVTMGLGNSVAAIFTNSDLNNTTAEATIAGWTTITNVEGYQGINLNNGDGICYYYSQWNRAALTINQLYERTKWIQMRALDEDFCTTATGKDNPLGNGTIERQAQSFTVGANNMVLTRVRFRLKKTGSPTANMTAKLYAHSGTYGTSSVPTGAATATSDTIPASRLRTSYDVIEFTFSGVEQVTLTAAAYYCISLEFTGDASNYVNMDSNETTVHGGNRSSYAAAAWTEDATDDLYFRVFSSAPIHSMSGELFRGITHQWNYTGETGGNFTEDSVLSWGSGDTAGTAALIALLDSGTTGTMWVQLLSGVAPTDTLAVTSGASSCAVSGAPTARSLSPAFLGTSTGAALIGAFGIGVEAADLSKDDKLFDLTNTQRIPPNNVTFTVGSVISTDYVLVGPKAAGNDFDYDQLTLDTTLASGSTTVVVTVAIPSDTPTSGTIRVLDNNGVYIRCPYTSWTGSTFTLTGTFGSAATAPKNVMISYIDDAAGSTSINFQTKYSSDRDLYVRVRDAQGTPIKTFESPATLGASSSTLSAIRTDDA